MSKKININQLKRGMYVYGFETASSELMLFNNSIYIRNELDLKKIVEEASKKYAKAYVEEEMQPEKTEPGKEFVTPENPVCNDGFIDYAAGLEGKTKEDPVEFEAELARAKEVKAQAESALRDYFGSIRAGQPVSLNRISTVTEQMIDSITRNRDALASLARIKSYDDYTYVHSVNVCILSLAVGNSLALGKKDLLDLCIGALLHDAGKIFLPESLLKKTGTLSQEEYNLVKKHTVFGFKSICESTDLDKGSQFVLLQHHERMDGNGYPGRIHGPSIHHYSRIAAAADVYDAMTTERPYKSAVSPTQALRELFIHKGMQFDTDIVIRLIKSLGVYPIGSVVELNTGEIAVVKSLRHDSPLAPLVLKLLDSDKKPFHAPFMNDLSRTGETISGYVNPGTYGIQEHLA